MPEQPNRENAEDAPEDMLGDMLRAADDLPPPEDYDADIQRFARPSAGMPAPPPIPPGAKPFVDLRNRAATWADLLRREEISFDDYQRLLTDGMVQDGEGIWWMIDAESDEWYRHNPGSNEWEIGYPAALRELEDAAADPEATLTQAAEYDLPPSLSEPQTGAPIYDERGVLIGHRPPTKDELYTLPGSAAFAHELPDQESTFAAPAETGGTMPAPARIEADIPRARELDYDMAPPVISEPLESRGSRRLRFAAVLGAGALMLACSAFIVGAFVVMMWYRDQVEPFADGIAALAGYTPAYQTARVYAADGSLIAALNSQETGARTAVSLERVSPYMIHAIVSQENERYFSDPGFDPIAIVRAFLQNLRGGGIESGASTITQQIARNLVLRDREITVERKLKEILVALEIANRYDKSRVLELYLNEIFFANQSYGVEAAANFYFGHGADELNFAESALLASIVPFPLQNDPVAHPDVAVVGMRSTMRKMIEVGCLQFRHGDWLARGPFCIEDGAVVPLDGGEAALVKTNGAGEIIGGAAILQIAEIESARFRAVEAFVRYPHFVELVRNTVAAEYGSDALYQRGLNIHTTLNPALQDAAQAALDNEIRRLTNLATGVNTGAVMVTEPGSGAIRAMVGSHDFNDPTAGQVNHALTYQQPGSAIKPFVMLAALEGAEGEYLTPASIIWDLPVREDLGAGGIYEPQNIDRRFHGPVPLRMALQNSYNVPAVLVFRDHVGVGRFANLAESLGLLFPPDSLVSLASALGANEVTLYDMMGAYAALANSGKRAPLYAIERITESVGNEDVELPRESPAPIQAVSPGLAYLMTNILSDDAARAPSFPPDSDLTLARLGIPALNRVAAKTGTTNGGRDLWTMGFTRNAVVGVWLGSSDNRPTFNTSGYRSAAPVWNEVMAAATVWHPVAPFENPGGVVAREICRTTGALIGPGCPQATTDLFLREQYPPGAERGFLQRMSVDSWTLRRANQFCGAHVIERAFVDASDAALDWLNNSEEGFDYAQSIDLELPALPPPTESCAQNQQLPQINLSSPNAGATVRGEVEIRGQVQAPNFDKFELLYARADAPELFFPISASLVEMPQYGTPLGSWDTVAAQVADGEVILRLEATSRLGGAITVDRRVRIDNSGYAGADEPVFGPTVTDISTPVPASR